MAKTPESDKADNLAEAERRIQVGPEREKDHSGLVSIGSGIPAGVPGSVDRSANLFLDNQLISLPE